MPKLRNNVNLKFVQLYREEECLWNVSILSYRNKSMLNAVIRKIYTELMTIGVKITINDCPKMWNMRPWQLWG